MQIVIPMSGFGERFRSAGYRVPKPLIEIEGKPIIAHVIDMFPGETDFIFICNQEHLDTPDFRMRELLNQFCPTGKIIGIPSHKLGPVNAVLQALDHIDAEKPTIVNYCDFTCVWDYQDFKNFVKETSCDGAIPCYTGFHPHMLNSSYYAYVREENGRIVDIQEKQPYTDTPMNEFASSGTHYFAKGSMVHEYFRRTMKRPDLLIGGEHYVSLVFKPMLEDDLKIAVYELNHFMQWGVPQDFEEYRYWSNAFRGLVNPERQAIDKTRTGTAMVPMAGLGSRFAQENYLLPKPLIPVSGEAMAIQATCDLPAMKDHVFVLRQDLPGHDLIAEALRKRFDGCKIIDLEELTDGQARTCIAGAREVNPGQVLTIGACDNGAIYDQAAFDALLENPEVDVIVWVARGYPGAVRRPQQSGWVEEKDGKVISVTGKQALNDPPHDPCLIGWFTFKRAGDFIAAAETLFARDGRVNGEFYVDTCINDAISMGLRCRIFEVEHYLCWGTPDDLRTFEYWQSCFHKWKTHPYSLDKDSRVARNALPALKLRYQMRQQERPDFADALAR
jgi:NDP-sugar pyrophosphorylase family protein